MAYLKCVLTMSICFLTSFQLDASSPDCKALKIESEIPGKRRATYLNKTITGTTDTFALILAD